jgi:hypothetical protein
MSGGFGDSGSPSNQFGDMGGQPVKKKSSTGKILLIVFGVGGLMVLLCCGGFIVMGMFGFNAGMSQLSEQVTAQLQGNEVIEKHLGTLESCKFNFMATTKRAQDTGEQGQMVFDLKGSNGSATLAGRLAGERLADATLELPTGESIDVPLD